jgi:uncharacterized protein YjbI with pentapeptide repeats
MGKMKLKQVTFERCRLREADFSETAFERTRIVDCDLTRTTFRRPAVKQSKMRRCALDGVRGLVELCGIAMELEDIRIAIARSRAEHQAAPLRDDHAPPPVKLHPLLLSASIFTASQRS